MLYGNGRIISAAVYWLYETYLNWSMPVTYVVSYAIGTVFLILAVYRTARVYEQYCPDALTAVFLAAFVLLNLFCIQFYLFVETGLLNASVFFAVLAFEALNRWWKEHKTRDLVLTEVWLFCAVFIYQTALGIFVVLCLPHLLEHTHDFRGFVKNNLILAGMYGNVNRKKRKDGTYYKDYYYYQCKHRTTVNGHKCGYKRQWKQELVDNAVEEVIRKLVNNPKFEDAIRQKIGAQIDTKELEAELTQLHKQLRQLNGAKTKLGQQMDGLDITDKYYDRKYQDMENRLCQFYDKIDSIEKQIDETETRIINIRQDRISEKNIYQFLLYFNEFYDRFNDAEKKEFLNCFIERVDIYEQEQPDGRFLKHIKFRFPVFFDGKETEELSRDNETTLESVALLSREG